MDHPIASLENIIVVLEQNSSSGSNVIHHHIEKVTTTSPTVLEVRNEWALIPGSQKQYVVPSGATKLKYTFDFDFGKNGERWDSMHAYNDGALSFRIMARINSSDEDENYPIREISHFSRYLTSETTIIQALLTNLADGDIIDFRSEIYHKTPWGSSTSGKILLNGTINYGSQGLMGNYPTGQQLLDRKPILEIIALL
jgi:hypothetical protein